MRAEGRPGDGSAPPWLGGRMGPAPRDGARDGDDAVEGVEAAHSALDFQIPSDVAAIEGAVARVVAHCRALHLPARACTFNIPVALSEALANAVVSGNHEDAAKQVHIRATVSPGEIVIDVTDEGAGFDLRRATREPGSPGSLEREDGRGLFLMRQLMDRVEQFHGSGNVVRMVLRR